MPNEGFIQAFPAINLLHRGKFRNLGLAKISDDVLRWKDLPSFDPVSINFGVWEEDPDLVGSDLEIATRDLGENSLPVTDSLVNCVPPDSNIVSGSHADAVSNLVTQNFEKKLFQFIV